VRKIQLLDVFERLYTADMKACILYFSCSILPREAERSAAKVSSRGQVLFWGLWIRDFRSDFRDFKDFSPDFKNFKDFKDLNNNSIGFCGCISRNSGRLSGISRGVMDFRSNFRGFHVGSQRISEFSGISHRLFRISWTDSGILHIGLQGF